VTTSAPHEGLLRRLALCVGVPVGVVSVEGGYATVAEFHGELDGWMAWYAVIRRKNDIRRKNAQLRACELFGEQAEPPPALVVSAASDDGISGVAQTPGIVDADHNVRVEVVSAGLLSNQRLGTLPKGAVRTRAVSCRLVCV
jgi:hypothetical protein